MPAYIFPDILPGGNPVGVVAAPISPMIKEGPALVIVFDKMA